MSDAGVRIEQVRVVRQTPRAILVTIDDEEHWIPQSQVHEDSEVWKDGDEGTLVITQWFANKMGLE